MRQLLKIMVPSIPLFLSCVDKVDLSLPVEYLPFIVDGMITTGPKPDTIRISKAFLADGSFNAPIGISGAKIAVTDDTGFTDSLLEVGHGEYVTHLLTRQVGRTYVLTLSLGDSIVAESTPQKLVSAGSVDKITYEFTSTYNTTTDLTENGFNIFIDVTLDPTSSGYLKWRFLGTYYVATDPSAFVLVPLPCAQDCECCRCWFTSTEAGPILATPEVSAGNRLDHVFVQYIPINSSTFHEKYRVQIFQTELSEEVFEFFKAISGQEKNSNSLFQPPFFEINGNVTEITGGKRVMGTFSASTVASRYIYISREAVPYELSSTLQPGDCRAIAPYGTLRPPWYWE